MRATRKRIVLRIDLVDTQALAILRQRQLNPRLDRLIFRGVTYASRRLLGYIGFSRFSINLALALTFRLLGLITIDLIPFCLIRTVL